MATVAIEVEEFRDELSELIARVDADALPHEMHVPWVLVAVKSCFEQSEQTSWGALPPTSTLYDAVYHAGQTQL